MTAPVPPPVHGGLSLPAGVKRDAASWIRCFQPSPQASYGLLCLPHAGGSASYFFQAARAMAPAAEVLAVQYPGRLERRAEERVEDIGVLADYVAEAARSWCDRPLALFGHSMGAILAFEVALRLERRGTAPLAVFASGRRAPFAYRNENLHLSHDSGLLAELRELSGTGAQVLADEDFVRLILPPLRSDFRAIERYRCQPGAKVMCPVFAMVGDEDPRTSTAEMQLWRAHTTGAFELHVFPGGHFYLNDRMTEVVELITSRIGSLSRQRAT